LDWRKISNRAANGLRKELLKNQILLSKHEAMMETTRGKRKFDTFLTSISAELFMPSGKIHAGTRWQRVLVS
jgi:hypothetical protein